MFLIPSLLRKEGRREGREERRRKGRKIPQVFVFIYMSLEKVVQRYILNVITSYF